VKFKFQSSMRYCMRLKDTKTDDKDEYSRDNKEKRRKLNDGNTIIFLGM